MDAGSVTDISRMQESERHVSLVTKKSMEGRTHCGGTSISTARGRTSDETLRISGSRTHSSWWRILRYFLLVMKTRSAVKRGDTCIAVRQAGACYLAL